MAHNFVTLWLLFVHYFSNEKTSALCNPMSKQICGRRIYHLLETVSTNLFYSNGYFTQLRPARSDATLWVANICCFALNMALNKTISAHKSAQRPPLAPSDRSSPYVMDLKYCSSRPRKATRRERECSRCPADSNYFNVARRAFGQDPRVAHKT